jgi:adenylate cyclase
MRFRLTIRTKLVGIMNLILLSAAVIIVIMATELFSRDNIARIQEGNLDTARLVASEIRNNLNNLNEKMRLIGVNILTSRSVAQRERQLRPLLSKEKDLILEAVFVRDGNGRRKVGDSKNVKILNELKISSKEVYAIHEKLSIKELFSGEEKIISGEIRGEIPVVTLAIPIQSDAKGRVTATAVATLKQDRFLKSVQSDSITQSYLVDNKGYLLAHPEQERVIKRENLAHLPIVKQLISGKNNNGQTRFTDPENNKIYLGSFYVVGFANMGVISQVEEAKALEAARKVRQISIIITAMVAIVGFLIVFFFSLSLTQPILRLVDASDKIGRGVYDINLQKRSKDEIGELTDSFNEMAAGLAEREKIKQAFDKFHSKEISDKLLSGELKLGGERKEAIVFFSDVRGFTAMSEKMDPEALVGILNRYMTKMVACIIDNGGIVDKYVGDAIMAVWGVPISKPDDAVRAVMACIDQRRALAELNDELQREGLPILKIGMGLNFGPLISGNIGSEQRMEYTVIGDTVNTASRVESLTKEFGTDCLISQSVLDQTGGKFIVTRTHEAKVKGKTEPLVIYTVQGYYDDNSMPVMVQTEWSSYEASKSDKVVHDSVPAPGPAAPAPAPQALAPAPMAAPAPAPQALAPAPMTAAAPVAAVTQAAPTPALQAPAPTAQTSASMAPTPMPQASVPVAPIPTPMPQASAPGGTLPGIPAGGLPAGAAPPQPQSTGSLPGLPSADQTVSFSMNADNAQAPPAPAVPAAPTAPSAPVPTAAPVAPTPVAPSAPPTVQLPDNTVGSFGISAAPTETTTRIKIKAPTQMMAAPGGPASGHTPAVPAAPAQPATPGTAPAQPATPMATPAEPVAAAAAAAEPTGGVAQPATPLEPTSVVDKNEDAA